MNFETFLNNIAEWATHAGLKLLAAVVVLIIGRLLIKWVMKLVGKGKMNKKLDHTVAQFLTNALRIALYVILVIIIIGVSYFYSAGHTINIVDLQNNGFFGHTETVITETSILVTYVAFAAAFVTAVVTEIWSAFK